MSVTIETTEWQTAPAPTTTPFVAIGDIHGASHLLRALRKHLDAEAPHQRIYLGDYIDPAPKWVSKHNVPAVLDMIADDLDQGHVALAGNHELMMRSCLDFGIHDPKTPPRMQTQEWLIYNNGNTTVSAFNVPDRAPFGDRMRMLRTNMSNRHHSVFDELKFFFQIEKYILVHAGLHDDADWRAQIDDVDWFQRPVPDRSSSWHPFWNVLAKDEGPSGYVQINGHEIFRAPLVGARRIAIDTGAKIGGPLTAVEIVEDRLRFHHACPSGVTMAGWARRE